MNEIAKTQQTLDQIAEHHYKFSSDIEQWLQLWDFWELITQPVVEREPNETDECYKERLLKYMEDNQ